VLLCRLWHGRVLALDRRRCATTFCASWAVCVPHYDIVLLDTGAGISDVVLFAGLTGLGGAGGRHTGAHLADRRLCHHQGVGGASESARPSGMVVNQTARLGRRPRHHGATAAGAGPLCAQSKPGQPIASWSTWAIFRPTQQVRQAIMRSQLLIAVHAGLHLPAMAVSPARPQN